MTHSHHSTRRGLVCLAVASSIAACGGSPAATIQGVAIAPQSSPMPKGATARLVAVGQFSDGTTANVSDRATWASASPSVASVASSGVVSAVSTGSTEITATVEQFTGRVTVTVGPAVPVGIEVTPAAVLLALGQAAPLHADAYTMSDGTRSPLEGAVTWSVQPEAVATIDATGRVQSRVQGFATIRASQGALSGVTSLTVGPPVPVSVAVSPASVTVVPGRPLSFTASATLSDGTVSDVTASAAWSSSNPDVFTMAGAQALCQGRGGATISAKAGDATGTAQVATIDTRIVFATSSHGTGNFGSWDYGVGKVGLQAADAVCQSSARAGRLPGTYRALVSDASDDAYCRLHGLHGKVAANCGQDALPVTAGPWIRTDGKPYAPRIDRMLDGEVFYPPGIDEFGRSATAWPAFTGSDYRAVRSVGTGLGDCAGWTSASDPAIAVGTYGSMTSFAIGIGGLQCNQAGALLCFEVGTGEGPALPPRNATGRLAFMTSVTGTGNLASWADAGTSTGIAAGDAVCRARAAAAGFPGADRFKAWLSDGSTNARDRITSDGPWVRPDGVLVAGSRSELLGGFLTSSVSVTETGLYADWVPGQGADGTWSTYAWTGTTQQGTAATDHCLSWQGAAGAVGVEGATIDVSNWSDLIGMGPADCSLPRALYCFED